MGEEDKEQVCFRSNISAAGKRARQRFASVLGLIGLVVVVGSVRYQWVPLWVSVSLGFFFSGAAIFVWLQTVRNVCAWLAVKGAKEKGDNTHFERVRDADELRAQRDVAWTILRDSLAGGAVVAAIVYGSLPLLLQ